MPERDEANPVYGAPAAGGLPITASIFADRAHLRSAMREDITACGLSIDAEGSLHDLLEIGSRRLGEVVLIDCPQVDAAALAALAQLDLRAARGEARLIVSTSVEALDAVFSCMD